MTSGLTGLLDFQPPDDRWFDHHRRPARPSVSLLFDGLNEIGGWSHCSLGGLIVIRVGLTIILWSTSDNLLNDHKWTLIVRSMAYVKGHTYKRLCRF
jgi:hypothetical protein